MKGDKKMDFTTMMAWGATFEDILNEAGITKEEWEELKEED